jgi:hypothetical protein
MRQKKEEAWDVVSTAAPLQQRPRVLLPSRTNRDGAKFHDARHMDGGRGWNSLRAQSQRPKCRRIKRAHAEPCHEAASSFPESCLFSLLFRRSWVPRAGKLAGKTVVVPDEERTTSFFSKDSLQACLLCRLCGPWLLWDLGRTKRCVESSCPQIVQVFLHRFLSLSLSLSQMCVCVCVCFTPKFLSSCQYPNFSDCGSLNFCSHWNSARLSVCCFLGLIDCEAAFVF